MTRLGRLRHGWGRPRWRTVEWTLLDRAVLALAGFLILYVLTPISPLSLRATAVPAEVLGLVGVAYGETQRTAGIILGAMSAAAGVYAWRTDVRDLARGYRLLFCAAGLWALLLLFGVAFTGAPVRNLFTVLYFAGIASSMWQHMPDDDLAADAPSADE